VTKPYEKLKVPSLVLAGDVPFEQPKHRQIPYTLKEVLDSVEGIPQISGVKIGVLTTDADFSLRQVCDYIHDRGLLVVHDMQKMGRDVSTPIVASQAELFASVADFVIVDPKKVEHWRAAYDVVERAGKGLITVLYMTDEGKDMTPGRHMTMLEICHDVKTSGRKLEGVVLPANNPEVTKFARHSLAYFDIAPTVFSPGIGAQGGESEVAAMAGSDIGIVGRAVLEAEDKRKAAEEIVAALERGYGKRPLIKSITTV
jgi:orotidine-5'-phosphate decarboxylase